MNKHHNSKTEGGMTSIQPGHSSPRSIGACEVRVVASRLILTIEGMESVRLEPSEARRLAKVLRRQADVSERHGRELRAYARKS